MLPVWRRGHSAHRRRPPGDATVTRR